MTDILTRPAPEQQAEEPASPTPVKRLWVVSFGLLIGALLALAVVVITDGPNRAELEQTRWEQVVDYYADQYQVIADTRARTEAAHWEDVVNHYARQYQLMANATNQSAPRNDAAHWQAVVDYYEQQWETRSQ